MKRFMLISVGFSFFCLQAMRVPHSVANPKNLNWKKIPAEFDSQATNEIIWLEPPWFQTDNFSCGDRALFHALGLYFALKHTTGRGDLGDTQFLKALIDNFSSKNLFIDVQQKIASIIPEGCPLDNERVKQIIERYFPELQNRTIILTKYKNSIAIPGEVPSKLNTELERVKRMIDSPKEAIFFICDVGRHVVLYALLTDFQKRAYLYVVDSLAHSSLVPSDPFLLLLRKILQDHNRSRRH